MEQNQTTIQPELDSFSDEERAVEMATPIPEVKQEYSKFPPFSPLLKEKSRFELGY